MTNIKYIILEQIINEGRLEDVIKKYNNVDEETIRSLSGNDPSGNNKYLEWMVKNIIISPESGNEIIDAVKCFHTNVNRLNDKTVAAIYSEQNFQNPSEEQKREFEKIKKTPKDINAYVSYLWIKPMCEYFEELKPATANRVKIWEDDRWLLISPLTHEASCKYGIHSSWCVSTSNSNYWNRYSKEGSLIFWLDKKELHPTRGQEVGNYKIAVHIKFPFFEKPIDWEWYSMEDQRMESSFMITILPKDGIEACKKYVGDIVKNKKNKINTFLDKLKPYVAGITTNRGYIHIFPKMLNGVIQDVPFLNDIIINYRGLPMNSYFNNYNGYDIPFLTLDISLLLTSNFEDMSDYFSQDDFGYHFLNNLKDKNQIVKLSEIIKSLDEDGVTKDLNSEAKEEIAYRLVLNFYKIMGEEGTKINQSTKNLSIGDTVVYKERGRKWGPGTNVTVVRLTDKFVFLSNDKKTARNEKNTMLKILPPPKLVDDRIREQRWIRKYII